MMDSPQFTRGEYDTRFIEEYFSPQDLEAGTRNYPEIAALMAVLTSRQEMAKSVQAQTARGSRWKWSARRSEGRH
jgi:hypothetical protein